MYEREQELVGLLTSQCGTLEEVQKLMRYLFKDTLEQMLESEMEEHLQPPRPGVPNKSTDLLGWRLASRAVRVAPRHFPQSAW